VARRDGGVRLQQELAHRLAEEIRAPDHDGLGTFELRADLVEQDHHALRGARPQALAAERQEPGGDRGQAVDVFVGVDQAGDLHAVHVVGHRQLAEDAADLVVGVQPLDQRDHLVLGRVGAQPVVEALDADLGRRLLLAVDVERARGVVADQDRRQAGRAPVLGDELLDLLGDLCAHARRHRLAVDDLRRHRG
jgi:hypothetical protein